MHLVLLERVEDLQTIAARLALGLACDWIRWITPPATFQLFQVLHVKLILESDLPQGLRDRIRHIIFMPTARALTPIGFVRHWPLDLRRICPAVAPAPVRRLGLLDPWKQRRW